MKPGALGTRHRPYKFDMLDWIHRHPDGGTVKGIADAMGWPLQRTYMALTDLLNHAVVRDTTYRPYYYRLATEEEARRGYVLRA